MYILSALNSLAYGTTWVVLFDLAHPGRSLTAAQYSDARLTFVHVYSFSNLAPAFGPLLFDVLSGRLYDQHADAAAHTCLGSRCYHTYFIITAAVLVVCVVVSANLTLGRYRSDAAAAAKLDDGEPLLKQARATSSECWAQSRRGERVWL